MKNNHAAGGWPAFPPSVVVQVKALACELPYRLGLPLSRFSMADIRREVIAQGITAEISYHLQSRWYEDAPRMGASILGRPPWGR